MIHSLVQLLKIGVSLPLGCNWHESRDGQMINILRWKVKGEKEVEKLPCVLNF